MNKDILTLEQVLRLRKKEELKETEVIYVDFKKKVILGTETHVVKK